MGAGGQVWLHRERDSFMARFGGTSIVRDNAILAIVEYIPTSHNTDALAENNKIKHNTGIGEGALTSMKWIKPVHKRAVGQLVAHLVVQFSSVNSANHAIWDGLVIAGKHVWDRRMCREPIRCLKCQKLNANHLAARCTCRETCSTCRDEHRMAE